MKPLDMILLLSLGLAIWIAGTIYYGYRGAGVLETTALRYWIAFTISPIVSAALCIVILKFRGIPPQQWASAMLLLAIPGMVGEALVLSNFAWFMPRVHEVSAGRYGAFLFATYAVVLAIAEAVTLRAAPHLQ